MAEPYDVFGVVNGKEVTTCPICGALFETHLRDRHERSHKQWPLYEKGD